MNPGPQGKNRSKKRGFTLIELLVVISIIGILASLILPGIMSARRAARRAQCLSRMRQVGLALVQFATNKNKFPASGYWNVTTAPREVGGNLALTGGDWDFSNAANALGDYDSTAAGMKYSWVLDVLPFLEHSDIYDAWDFSVDGGSWGSYIDTVVTPGKRPHGTTGSLKGLSHTDLKVLRCPEDITTIDNEGNLSYVVNGGFTFHWLVDGFDEEGDELFSDAGSQWQVSNHFNMGLMFLDTTQGGTSASRRHTLSSIKDGTTFTALLSENLNAGYGENRPYVQNWACPHPFNTSFTINANSVGVLPYVANVAYSYASANTRGPNARPSVTNPSGTAEGGINGDLSGLNEGAFPYPNSFHSGGVHVVMCDGNVRFLSENIDGETWARLVTPAGSQLGGPEDMSGTLLRTYEDQTPRGNRQKPINEEKL